MEQMTAGHDEVLMEYASGFDEMHIAELVNALSYDQLETFAYYIDLAIEQFKLPN